MAGFGDLFGRNGALEQIVLWQILGQVVSALGNPAFTTLQQDVNEKNPVVALVPQQAAEAVARTFLADNAGEQDAAKGGIDHGRFSTMVEMARQRLTVEVLAQAVERGQLDEGQAVEQAKQQGLDERWFAVLRQLAKVRLSPGDLATAVLRAYMTTAEAEAQAKPQGIDAAQLRILTNLAGDALGPDQLVAALRRGIIERGGMGANSTSYDQGIAESRLHNKWGPVLEKLGKVLLSPPDAASAVVRNFLDLADATAIAGAQGVDSTTFAVMTHLSADAPGPEQLAEALRRGLIDPEGTGPESTSFQQGIAEGRLADKWTSVIKGLALLWPTPVDALAAVLKGQVTPDEGQRLYELLGGDLQFYTWLLDSQGEGPTPLEAINMANRGFIAWDGTGPDVVSYAQAFKESRFRDKWAAPYQQYANYLPPPETVRSLLEQGAIDDATAVALWHKSGMDEQTVSAYLQAAEFNNTAATRGLSINEVLNLYYSYVTTEDVTAQLLQLFHVPATTANMLIGYTQMRRTIAAVNTTVKRIQTLFTTRKISVESATAALSRFGVPDATIEGLIQTWEVGASVNVKTLTEAQIVDAWEIGAFNDDEAMAELVALGYTPYDAWALMSIKKKTPLDNKPERIVAEPLGAVTPGVT